MPVGAVIGSAVVGAGSSIIAGNKAASAQQYAADKSAEVEKYMYDQTRTDYAPYRNVGTNALYKMAQWAGVGTAAQPTGTTTTGGQTVSLPGGGTYTMPGTTQAAAPAGTQNGTPDFSSFYASPGYQFRLQEGMKAIQNSAAARGGLRSGATMKSLNNYAQGEASQEYGNEWNRLAGLAGVGQTATGSTAQAGANYANGAANAYTNAGNARASAYQNTGNAINQGVGNVASAYLYSKGYGGGGGVAGNAWDPTYDYGMGG